MSIEDYRISSAEPVVAAPTKEPTSRSIDWYAEGESRTVEVLGVQVSVRFISRKGRRARIMIAAPAGATFSSIVAGGESDRTTQ